jgi:hypothetical protein
MYVRGGGTGQVSTHIIELVRDVEPDFAACDYVGRLRRTG